MDILRVFPTNRSIRYSFYGTFDAILPKCMSVGEFEKRAVLVKGKKEIDSDKRVLLLKKASSFKNFEKLKIKRDYLSFLKSSDFLFGFFEELSIERVSIDDIDSNDTYAQYPEHLFVLRELLESYKKILDKEGYYDKITLPDIYELNDVYLKRFKKIEFFLEGYLSRFELELFLKISDMVNFSIFFEANRYNKKMIDRFNELGFKLKEGYGYELDLKNRVILSKNEVDDKIGEISFFSTQNRIEQVAYIKKKIYDFIGSGICAENIVLITPEESFSKILREFDDERVFNFAMGIPFNESKLYKKVDAFYRYLEEKDIKNSFRLFRFFDHEKIDALYSDINKSLPFEDIIKKFLDPSDSLEEILIFEEEIFKFKRVKEELSGYSFKELLYLFLSRLRKRSLDDNRGGKITVMGVLESRMVDYEAVLIVDFNEEFVPRRGQKELFLSTDIRKKADLPTKKDRENLQKLYYHQILRRAKKRAICAVDSDVAKPSRFLEELEIAKLKQENFSHQKLFFILNSKAQDIKRFEFDDLRMEYDFTKVNISSSLLKTYLECKRRYYFRYIKKLEEFEIPKKEKDDRQIGIFLHLILKEIYSEKNFYDDEDKLLRDITLTVKKEVKDDRVFRLVCDIWLERLKNFARNEVSRFKSGYRVLYTEKRLFGEFEGFKINGIVDRIDTKEKELSLLDYKTGGIKLSNGRDIEKSTDFQMEFYHILSNQIAPVAEVGFYDLKNADIKKEVYLEEKMEVLKKRFELLRDKEQNFTKCEDLKICRNCPYTILCGRDA